MSKSQVDALDSDAEKGMYNEYVLYRYNVYCLYTYSMNEYPNDGCSGVIDN